MSRPAWFATLPAAWTSRPLGYSFDISLGKMVNAAKDAGEAAPYLAAGSIQPQGLILDTQKTMAFTEAELRQYDLRTGDIVVVEGGAGYGRSLLLKENLPGWGFQNHVARLRAAGAVEPAYAQYSIQACVTSGYIEASNRTATLPSLSREVLRSLVLPHPPLSEQRAIADFLDSETAQIDTLIAKQERLIETLRERRSAAASVAAWGTRADGDTVRHDPLGSTPSHWRRVRNKNLLLESADVSEDGTEPLLSVSHLTGVTLRAEKNVTMFEAESTVGYRIVHRGDLVINTMWAWMGALGASKLNGIVSPAYGVYRATGELAYHAAYFDALYRSRRYVDLMTIHSRGIWSSRLRLYPEVFLALPVAVPPLREQAEIAERVGQATAQSDALISKAERVIELSKERRSALITAAVTGQIDVAEQLAES